MLEMEEAPDFVLLDADRNDLAAVSEVEQITRSWPKTDCVAMVDNSSHFQLLKDAGASLTLLKGATPQRLREVLQALAEYKRRSKIAARPFTSQL
jgi:DNA-binding NarL/FixJ family response regulator